MKIIGKCLILLLVMMTPITITMTQTLTLTKNGSKEEMNEEWFQGRDEWD